MNNKKIYINTNSTILKNKFILNKYFIEKNFESGISLQSWEIKSIKSGKINIRNSYILIKNNEAYLFNSSIEPIFSRNSHQIYNSNRTRKLLLKKKEIIQLYEYNIKKHYTILILSLYWKNCWIKANVGIVKSKKVQDKREILKNTDWKINQSRILKNKLIKF